MGVQNVVPILLCHLPASGAERLSVTLDVEFHHEEGNARPKWPDVYARYYFSGDDTPVVEKLECVNVQSNHQVVYILSFKHKSASFLDCLAMEANLVCPDFAVLKQCAIQMEPLNQRT